MTVTDAKSTCVQSKYQQKVISSIQLQKPPANLAPSAGHETHELEWNGYSSQAPAENPKNLATIWRGG